MLQPLKFGNGWVILYNIWIGVWLLMHVGVKVHPYLLKRPQDCKKLIFFCCSIFPRRDTSTPTSDRKRHDREFFRHCTRWCYWWGFEIRHGHVTYHCGHLCLQPRSHNCRISSRWKTMLRELATTTLPKGKKNTSCNHTNSVWIYQEQGKQTLDIPIYDYGASYIHK